jgi:hypothetical protein
LCVLSLSIDSRTEPEAGSPEEVERVIGVAPAETIEFPGESRNVQSVAIVPRHGKTQQRQLPGTEQPVMSIV